MACARTRKECEQVCCRWGCSLEEMDGGVLPWCWEARLDRGLEFCQGDWLGCVGELGCRSSEGAISRPGGVLAWVHRGGGRGESQGHREVLALPGARRSGGVRPWAATDLGCCAMLCRRGRGLSHMGEMKKRRWIS